MTAILHAPTRPDTAKEGRGSGRRTRTCWYRVQCGGYETLHTAEGEPMAPEFVLDGFNIEVPSGGFFGVGVKEAIEAAALAQCPDKELIDFWPLSSPPATEL